MRKVIGIGETVFDIIFKNGQPISGRPGGSVFNAMISLGRMGQHPLLSVRWERILWARPSDSA